MPNCPHWECSFKKRNWPARRHRTVASAVPAGRPPDRLAADPADVVLAKLRAADSSPGVLDEIGGTQYYLIGGHPEDQLTGPPGTILARRDAPSAGPPVTGRSGSPAAPSYL